MNRETELTMVSNGLGYKKRVTVTAVAPNGEHVSSSQTEVIVSTQQNPDWQTAPYRGVPTLGV